MSGIIMSSPMLVFVDGSKGDFSNRMECSKEHIKNNLEYGVKGTAAGLVTAGATMAAVNPAFTNRVVKATGSAIGTKITNAAKIVSQKTPEGVKKAFKNVADKIGNFVPKNGIKKVTSKIQNIKVPQFIKNVKLPGKAKIFGVIAAAGAAAFTYFTAKYYHKKGQIDQKYTDMAAIKQHVANLYNPILK